MMNKPKMSMRKLVMISLAALLCAGAFAGTAMADPPAPYQSPMRAQCDKEITKDAAWQAQLRDEIRPLVHKEDADEMLANHRHVVMAYAALWILVVVFVVMLWLRQQRLRAEIDRLERDLAKAEKS